MGFRGLALLALSLATALSWARADEGPEIRWRKTFVGEAELALGGAYDLDFGDTGASQHDMQFEDWEGGVYWAPRRGAVAALAGPGDLEAFDLGSVDGLRPSRDRILLRPTEGPAVAAGTILAVITTDARYVKVSIESCAETLRFRWVTYEREVLQKPPPPGSLEAPVLKTPPDAVRFDHEPRDLLLAWGAVEGAASYSLELDCQGCCAPRKELFCAEQENGSSFIVKSDLLSPAYYTIWLGPFSGRWRVRAHGPGGKAGPWSAWSRFGFSK
jgi:hypothetical protein